MLFQLHTIGFDTTLIVTKLDEEKHDVFLFFVRYIIRTRLVWPWQTSVP